MAHYVVGDIQGCFQVLQKLLEKIDFNYGKDTLWFAGDIVNRGPESLKTLRFVKKHDDCFRMVLGNHDFHLLAVAHGYGSIKKNDTIQEIINASDSKILIDWLRSQPLILMKDDVILVHAGIHPQWDMKKVRENAQMVESSLQGSQYRSILENMYGNKPNIDSPDMNEEDKIRFIINVMTRMRVLGQDLKLDFKFKLSLRELSGNLTPWFRFPNLKLEQKNIIFGHWSAIGLHQENNTICLDTGAIWGGFLTALELDSQKIHKVRNIYGIDYI